MSGYTSGPSLNHYDLPWATQWERDVDETCAHEWEACLLLANGSMRAHEETVIRCRLCNVPRCGHSTDPDPCMERRHHRGLHIHLSGSFAPLGGLPDQFVDWGVR